MPLVKIAQLARHLPPDPDIWTHRRCCLDYFLFKNDFGIVLKPEFFGESAIVWRLSLDRSASSKPKLIEGAIGKMVIGKTQIDRSVGLFLFRQAVRIGARQRFQKRRLTGVDTPCRADDPSASCKRRDKRIFARGLMAIPRHSFD